MFAGTARVGAPANMIPRIPPPTNWAGAVRGCPGSPRLYLLKSGEWYVLASHHPSSQREHVHRFKSETEAKNWIARKSKAWLRKRG
jgi:hypothetical protein